jgi:glycosyltransferase involved in cell wall biosynthesis
MENNNKRYDMLEKKDNLLVSIILPVYKVEPYIQKCLDSVIGQTYKNLEIVIVNDGTPDNSMKICESYQKKDSRIHIINQENSGVSAARNNGLFNCHGEYCLFCDSDDTLEKDAIENLVKKAVQTNADVVRGGVTVFFGKGKREFIPANTDNPFRKITYIVSCLIKTSLLINEKIFFIDAKMGEDICFYYNFAICASSIETIDESIYNYYIRLNTFHKHKYDDVKTRFDMVRVVEFVLENMYRDVSGKYDDSVNAILSHFINIEFDSHVQMCGEVFDSYKEQLEKVIDTVCNENRVGYTQKEDFKTLRENLLNHAEFQNCFVYRKKIFRRYKFIYFWNIKNLKKMATKNIRRIKRKLCQL